MTILHGVSYIFFVRYYDFLMTYESDYYGKSPLKIFLFLLFFGFFGLKTASAATIVVNSLDDEINQDAECSFREAFVAVQENVSTGGCPAGDGVDDTIDLSGLSGTISISGPELVVKSSKLIILGPGSSVLTLDGIDKSHRLFEFMETGVQNLDISSLTIMNFGTTTPSQYGGAIYVQPGDTLTLHHVVVQGNKATKGGSIYNEQGTLDIYDGTFLENKADFAGAILNNQGNAEIQRSVFRNNTAHQVAGAITNLGTMHILTSTVDHNQSDDLGGGISNENGTLFLDQSTVSHNHAGAGGGFFNYGSIQATNATISGNAADSYGGGIYNDFGGTLSFVHVTLAANRGDTLGQLSEPGGAAFYQADPNDTLYFENSILSKNMSGPNQEREEDCTGTISTGGVNVIMGVDGCTGFDSQHDLIHKDPLLKPLASNDDTSATMALDPYSPAKDAAKTGLNTDQRGISRPQGEGYDVGAFEFRNMIDGVYLPQAPGGSDISAQPDTPVFDPPSSDQSPVPFSANPDSISVQDQVHQPFSSALSSLPQTTTVISGPPSVPKPYFIDITGNFAEVEIKQLYQRCPGVDFSSKNIGQNGLLSALLALKVSDADSGISNLAQKIFQPRLTISRGLLIDFLVQCRFGRQPSLAASDAKPFLDVAPDYFAAASIARAKKEKIIMGYPDGNFYPERAATFSEAVKMIELTWIDSQNIQDTSAALNAGPCLASSTQLWYWPFLKFGISREIFDGFPLDANDLPVVCRPHHAVSKAEAAALIVRIAKMAQ